MAGHDTLAATGTRTRLLVWVLVEPRGEEPLVVWSTVLVDADMLHALWFVPSGDRFPSWGLLLRRLWCEMP